MDNILIPFKKRQFELINSEFAQEEEGQVMETVEQEGSSNSWNKTSINNCSDMGILIFPRKKRICLEFSQQAKDRVIETVEQEGSNQNETSISTCIDMGVRLVPPKKRLRLDDDVSAAVQNQQMTVRNSDSVSFELKSKLPAPINIQCYGAEALRPNIEKILQIKDIRDVKLVIEKELEASDVIEQQARLSIPCKKLLAPDFLTDFEKNWLQRVSSYGKRSAKSQLSVKVIGPSEVEHELSLSRWNYHGGEGYRYALKGGWYEFLQENGLKKGDVVSVVSFRADRWLYLLLLKSNTSVRYYLPPCWGHKRPRN